LDEEFINAPQKAPTLRDGDFVGDSWGTLYGARDCNGHGTHIAGIVADKNFGIAKNSQIVALRVINCKGVGDVENLLDSISWLYENAIKPAVVLMSLGFGDNSQIRDAVDSSASKGLIFIVSSGQKYSDSCKTAPGGAIRAITVGGYTQALEPLPMNNWGRCIDIFAPGEKIYSLSHLNHELKSKKGSSMAAPFVAGAAAIILSKHKNYNWQDVKKLLLKNSKKDFLILNSGMRLRKTSNRALYIP
ncbi:MAG: S8 family serine peptidase, partial [Deltaproteobacteria bacterium]|nr:S8 family serine peptidase [Deltaproteobacteria bacterium]